MRALLANNAAVVGEDDLLALAAYVAVQGDQVIITLEVSPPPDEPNLPSHLQYLSPNHEAVVAWREQWSRDRDDFRSTSKTSTPLSAVLHRVCAERIEPANEGPFRSILATLELRLSR